MKSAVAAKPRKPASPAKIAGTDERTLQSLTDVFKSLSDRWRLSILLILAREGETHVSAICDKLGQSQPSVSHHLQQLRSAGLVAYRRDGKFNHYAIDSELVSTIIAKFFPEAGSSQQKIGFGDLEFIFRTK
jgi:ArsR family transcriptional regulator